MDKMDETIKEVNKLREAEHRARLKRQTKRKVILTLAVIGVFCLVPVFCYIGFRIENAAKKEARIKEIESEQVHSDVYGGFIFDYGIDIDEDTEQKKNTPSDIEGLSVYEKNRMGLLPYEGCDTDYDGLLDKEEIEIYGSDPLKCSTSGDLYSDSYKINHGMDINTYYDYDGETQIVDESGIFTFTAGSPFDLNQEGLSNTQHDPMGWVRYYGIQVEDVTSNHAEYSDYKLIAEQYYRVYHIKQFYGDTFEIDMDLLAEELDTKRNGLGVEIFDDQDRLAFDISGSEKKTVKVTTKDGSKPSTFGRSYYVFITKEDTFSLFGKEQDTDGSAKPISFDYMGVDVRTGELVEYGYSEDHGFILVCPALTVFLHNAPKLYASEDATPDEVAVLVAQGTKVFQNLFYEPMWVERPVCTEEDVIYVSTKTIRRMNRICEKILGRANKITKDGEADKKNRRLEILCYQNLGDFYANAAAEVAVDEAEKYREKNWFGNDDRFPFLNYTSKYTGCGVCAGIARIEAEVYNNGKILQSSAEYDNKDYIPEPISFDLTLDENNNTFFDRYLSDYEIKNLGNSKPNQDDEIFTECNKTIAHYWAQGNELANEQPVNALYCNGDYTKKARIDWSTIEKAMKYHDNNKALIACFCIGNQFDGGHAVVLGNYESDVKKEDTDNGKLYIHADGKTGEVDEIVKFIVYDPNYFQKGSLYCYRVDDCCFYQYYNAASNAKVISQYLRTESDYTIIEGDKETPIENCAIYFDIYVPETMEKL